MSSPVPYPLFLNYKSPKHSHKQWKSWSHWPFFCSDSLGRKACLSGHACWYCLNRKLQLLKCSCPLPGQNLTSCPLCSFFPFENREQNLSFLFDKIVSRTKHTHTHTHTKCLFCFQSIFNTINKSNWPLLVSLPPLATKCQEGLTWLMPAQSWMWSITVEAFRGVRNRLRTA